MIMVEGWDFYPSSTDPDIFIGEKEEEVFTHINDEDVYWGRVIIRAKFQKDPSKDGKPVYKLISFK